MAANDLHSELSYLETRVGLAKILFPMEARVAMDIVQVEATAPSMTMDLDDSSVKVNEELQARLRALTKAVELGKQFFPRCSDVLNKILDDDELSELAELEHVTQEEQELKRQRFTEIRSTMMQAFNADKEEFDKSIIP